MEIKGYDIVVIGGGAAGLVCASGAAQLGARAALVEKASLGGDCLRSGCVPTKRLIYSARVASLLGRATEFGIEAGGVKADFQKVMEKMREVQKTISLHDDPERFRKMGVAVYSGAGRFSDSHTLEVNGERIKGKRFVIATGSSPVMLPIPGLKEAGALTNETALMLTRLPPKLAILGAGPIGVEFAQAFSRLGSEVIVIEKLGEILPREDVEISRTLKGMLEAEGVKVALSTEIKDVLRSGGAKVLNASGPDGERQFPVDEVMAAIGRSPNVAGLNLEAAGVEYDSRKGIKTDDTLRTTASHIYACGDCIGGYAFTHVAEYQAGVVLSNALFPLVRRRVDYRVVPWTTFTDPELARVGLTEEEAKSRYGAGKVKVYRFHFKDVDRAIIEGQGRGVIKIICGRGQRLLGAHILGPGAGELIHEYSLAMSAGLPITRISRAMHVYPTLSQGVKRACDEYYRERLFTGFFPKLARWLIRRT